MSEIDEKYYQLATENKIILVMKILIFIDSIGAGGAEKSMVELAKFLTKQPGFEVKFLCINQQEIGFLEEVQSHDIPIIFFKDTSGYFKKLEFLNKTITKENPDIIHSVLAESNFLLRLVRVFNKKGKIIQSLVNTPYTEERKRDSQLPLLKYKMAKIFDEYSGKVNRGIHYHVITNEVLDHYREFLNIDNNYSLIYRGRRKNEYLERVSKESSNFKLINVGRQVFAKGQLDILKAFNYLRETNRLETIKLKILGKEGRHTKTLNEFVIHNKLQSHVEILGFVRNVEEELAAANAFVFPSYYEGLGGALVEAFSAKLPVICSNIPVLGEVVGNEEGALFSEPGDYKQLAENIYTLSNDQNLQSSLSTYSSKRFLENFQIDDIHQKMLNMYLKVYSS